jgi:hypothetical protein
MERVTIPIEEEEVAHLPGIGARADDDGKRPCEQTGAAGLLDRGGVGIASGLSDRDDGVAAALVHAVVLIGVETAPPGAVGETETVPERLSVDVLRVRRHLGPRRSAEGAKPCLRRTGGECSSRPSSHGIRVLPGARAGVHGGAEAPPCPVS